MLILGFDLYYVYGREWLPPGRTAKTTVKPQGLTVLLSDRN
jgi:hypothetical protein